MRSASRLTLLVAVMLACWPAATAGAADLPAGQAAHVANTEGRGVRLRDTPSLTAPVLLLLREGEEVRIVGGPTVAERYRWYRVRVGADTGWMVEDWLRAGAAPARSQPPPPPGGATMLRPAPVGAVSPPVVTAVATPTPTQRPAPTATLAPTATRTPTTTPPPVAQSSPSLTVGSFAAVVNTEGRGLRLRDGAGTSEPVRIAAAEGDVLAVLAGPVRAEGLDWYRVKLGDTIGWAAAGWLAPASRTAIASATAIAASTPAIVAARSTPTVVPAISVPAGEPPVAPSGQTVSDAIRVRPTGGDVGSRAARLALGFLGQDYVWGGVQPGAFDCEGLVWYVYRQLGIALPWGTWNQFSVGTRIDAADIRPGDLVFFRNTYAYGVTHVGLAIGAGQFVHALNEEAGVVVSSLDAPYWRAHFTGARRVTE